MVVVRVGYSCKIFGNVFIRNTMQMRQIDNTAEYL